MPHPPGYLPIDLPRLAAAVEQMTPDEINQLPFGAIRLDAHGVVTFYSDKERLQSGMRKDALSRQFFTDIAPCLDSPQFRGRIDKALAEGALDILFDYVADLPSGEPDVEMQVRVQSSAGGACWIFVQLLS